MMANRHVLSATESVIRSFVYASICVHFEFVQFGLVHEESSCC